MATLTAVVQGDKSVLLTCGALPEGFLTVTRSDGVVVRHFNTRYVLAGTTTGYDYEPPQNTALTYSLTVANSNGDVLGGGTAGPVTAAAQVDHGYDRLYDSATNTGLNVYVADATKREFKIGRSVAKVIGRTDPVAVSDNRQAWSGSITLATLTLADAATLRGFLATGQPVALAQRYQTYGLNPVEWLSVGDVTETRYTPLAVETARAFQMDVESVSPPPAQVTNYFVWGVSVWGGPDVWAP